MLLLYFLFSVSVRGGGRPIDEKDGENIIVLRNDIDKNFLNITQTYQQPCNIVIYIETKIEKNQQTDFDLNLSSISIDDFKVEKKHDYIFMAIGFVNILTTIFSTLIIVHYWRTTGRYDVLPIASQRSLPSPPPSLESFIVSSETYI